MRFSRIAQGIAIWFALATNSWAQAEDSPMTFRLVGTGGNCNGCEWTAAEGVITTDTPQRLKDYLAEYQIGRFVFNSPGGNLVAALEMGTLLRASNSATAVGRTIPDGYGWHKTESGRCVSACAFAFLGGVSRDAEQNELGVHQFYDEVSLSRPNDPIYNALDMSSNQMVSALLVNYAVEMGVDPRFISKAALILPTDMHFLSGVELDEWKVRYDPALIGEWKIEPWRDGVIAFAKSADERTTVTMFCDSKRLPQLFINEKLDRPSTGDYGNPALSIRSISVFGQQVTPGSVRTRYEGSDYFLSIRMLGFDIGALPEDGEIGIEADVPRVYQSAFYYPMRAAGAKRHISIALRNCVS